MTDDLSAIQATYSDFKVIKTRSVVSLSFEVPIENAQQVLDLLGIPQPAHELFCAIAVLKPEAMSENSLAAQGPGQTPKPPRKSWYEMQPSQRAGIMCEEDRFWSWIEMVDPQAEFPDAASWMRAELGIDSRSWLDDMEAGHPILEHFEQIESAYRQWAGKEPDPRDEQVRDCAAGRPASGSVSPSPAVQPEGTDRAEPSVFEAVKLALEQCQTVEQLKACARENNPAVQKHCTQEERKALREKMEEMRGKIEEARDE